MSFYMAMPSNWDFIKKRGTLVWIGPESWVNSKSEVWESCGRLYLFRKGFKVAELIWGMEGLKKYHKGSFEVWCEKIKQKDLDKSKKMRGEASELISNCDEIDAMWKD